MNVLSFGSECPLKVHVLTVWSQTMALLGDDKTFRKQGLIEGN